MMLSNRARRDRDRMRRVMRLRAGPYDRRRWKRANRIEAQVRRETMRRLGEQLQRSCENAGRAMATIGRNITDAFEVAVWGAPIIVASPRDARKQKGFG